MIRLLFSLNRYNYLCGIRFGFLHMTTLTFFTFTKNRFWAFTQMQLAYQSLLGVKGLEFCKMLGTGAGNGFSLWPDFSTYALLIVWKSKKEANVFLKTHQLSKQFDSKASSKTTYFLQTIKSHGKWDGGNPFSAFDKKEKGGGKIGIITRATLNKSRLIEFWQSVPKASKAIANASGVSWFKGIGEWPFIQQATFSIWESEDAVQEFAYRSRPHANIVAKTRKRNWYKEDLFARFEIIDIQKTHFT